jgi:hypothetical protein
MLYRHLLTVIAASLLLNACVSSPTVVPAPAPGVSSTNIQRPVLASALVKRPLRLGRIDGQVVPLAQIAGTDAAFAVKMDVVAGVTSSDPAIGRMSIAPGYYYGGNDFNSFSIQYAEENIYPAAQGDAMIAVYNQSIKSIVAEWDADARLLESRGQQNGENEEYIQFPGKDEPIRLKPRFVYRLASNAKKETLNIYVLDKEVRVHRMVWGEQNIEIARVKIDSDAALSIARRAFSNKQDPSGIPVYPEANNSEATVIYDIPQDIQWNLNLNQQSRDSLRYFVNINFEVKSSSLPAPKPPRPDNANEPSLVYPQQETQYLYGSVEVDAITGEIKSMNRPVVYPMYRGGEPVAYDGGGTPMPVDVVAAAPANEDQGV